MGGRKRGMPAWSAYPIARAAPIAPIASSLLRASNTTFASIVSRSFAFHLESGERGCSCRTSGDSRRESSLLPAESFQPGQPKTGGDSGADPSSERTLLSSGHRASSVAALTISSSAPFNPGNLDCLGIDPQDMVESSCTGSSFRIILFRLLNRRHEWFRPGRACPFLIHPPALGWCRAVAKLAVVIDR